MADSIRDALTSAIDKAGKAPVDEVEKDVVAGDDAADDSASVSTDDPVSNADAAPDSPPDADTQDASVASAPITPAEPASPAPASWTNEERAEWAKVAPAAQKAILRRENEMQRAFQASAVARKRVEALDGITSNYKPMLDHYGTTIEAVLPPLLATRAALEVGTPEQKAQLVANICADFGINIETLDDALQARFSGGGPPQRQQPAPAPSIHPEVQALIDTIKESKQARAAEALAPVTSQPHYEEVRFTMADLIDKAHQSGRSLDVSKAYAVACTIHGFDAPQGTPQVTTSQAAAILARSRNAASSVSGAPQPSPARKPGEGSVADEVTALMSAARR